MCTLPPDTTLQMAWNATRTNHELYDSCTHDSAVQFDVFLALWQNDSEETRECGRYRK
jgi:hypothetical protein